MKRKILAGTTSLKLGLFIQNSSVTTGGGLTGLTSGTSGLIWYYWRNGDSSSTQVTLAAGTLGSFTSGGFVAVDATNMPGCYEIGIPNAALASGSDTVRMMLSGAANMVPTLIEIELDQVNYQDPVHFGLSALPNTACTTNASLLTSGTGTDQVSVSSGKVLLQATQSGVTIPTVTTVTNQLTAAAIATGVWQDATAGDFTASGSIGKALFVSAIPGAAGGHFIAGTNAATTITTALTTTFTGSLTGSVASVTGAVGSVTGNVGGNVAGSVAGVTGNVGGSVGSVTAAVTVSLTQALNAARALDAIGDTSLTLNDAFHCAIAGATGKESVSGTTYLIQTPSTGTTLRTFTLDSGTAPTQRS